MKAKPGFNLRTVCGNNMIVAEGRENIDFSNVISMNETSAYLWRKVQPLDSFTADDLVSLLREEYEVDVDRAQKDVAMLVNQWNIAGIIDVDA